MNDMAELTRYEVQPSNKRWMIYWRRGRLRGLAAWRPTEKAARMWAKELEARDADLYEEVRRGVFRG